MDNRRERFREFAANMSPAGDPVRAIEGGHYVPMPGTPVSQQLAGRLDLRPSTAHILVGNIGSGKTTELLMAAKLLNQTPDVRALYVDVSQQLRLTRMEPGILSIAAGLYLALLTPEDQPEALGLGTAVAQAAAGFRCIVPDFDTEGFPDGFLWPPPPELKVLLRAATADSARHLVLLFDSLDRVLESHGTFVEQIREDVRLLQDVGIGTVIVAPLRTMFGRERALAGYFDSFNYLPAVDVANDASGRAFLREVLLRRAPQELLPEPACAAIVQYSGGVLRDLLTLARAAGEEAYVRGSDTITPAHVAVAAETFGRNRAIGLDEVEIRMLVRVRDSARFTETADGRGTALLVRGLVLDRGAEPDRFVVHPAIAPLLPPPVVLDVPF